MQQVQLCYLKLALGIAQPLQVDQTGRVVNEVKAEGMASQKEEKVVHRLETRWGLNGRNIDRR